MFFKLREAKKWRLGSVYQSVTADRRLIRVFLINSTMNLTIYGQPGYGQPGQVRSNRGLDPDSARAWLTESQR